MIDSPAIEKELAKRMDELKRHPEELMRYDRNGDGVIDEQEWAEIRKILRLEIATDQQRAARQTTPHDNASSYERQILRGRYIYQEKIGEGSQGVTWLAFDQETGQPVLVKIVDLERLDEWNNLEMLERSMQTLQRINHPAVPAYIDSFQGEEGDASYILIREYVEGTDLREQIAASQPTSEEEAWVFLEDMLDVLNYLHTQNPPVIHRDIKPGNIICTQEGAWKLVDFGTVQYVTENNTDRITAGTFGYMPPEQMVGRALPASDLYALGATLVHLLSHIHPADLPLEHMKLQYDDVIHVSDELSSILAYMLEPEVEQRVTTAKLLLERIQRTHLQRKIAEEKQARNAKLPTVDYEALKQKLSYVLVHRFSVGPQAENENLSFRVALTETVQVIHPEPEPLDEKSRWVNLFGGFKFLWPGITYLIQYVAAEIWGFWFVYSVVLLVILADFPYADANTADGHAYLIIVLVMIGVFIGGVFAVRPIKNWARARTQRTITLKDGTLTLYNTSVALRPNMVAFVGYLNKKFRHPSMMVYNPNEPNNPLLISYEQIRTMGVGLPPGQQQWICDEINRHIQLLEESN